MGILNELARLESARSAVAVDLSSTDYTTATPTKGVYVGGAGAVKADMADGTTVTFMATLAGTLYPLSVIKIYQTGTVATNLIALF